MSTATDTTSPKAYSLAPSLALFEKASLHERLQTCHDMEELCRIIIENQHRTKGEDEEGLSPNSQLPGLCSAVEALGGADAVLDFDSPDGLYQRLIRASSELQALFPSLEIPTLSREGGNSSVHLTARQVRCLLAIAVLGNVSRIPLPSDVPEQCRETVPHYGSLSWHLVFDSPRDLATERVKGLVLYFQQSLHEADDQLNRPITFRRMALDDTFSLSTQLAATKTLAPVTFFRGGVEVAPNADAMVDFANEDLHVGAVWPCATQEEILFTIHPECFVGLLFCETMRATESIQISGVRAYCQTTGFQSTFRVTGQSLDAEPKTILAMDASMADSDLWISDQCSGKKRDRDIVKAVSAFSSVAGRSVATGHWGCGAFGGDVYCKFLAQWIAASLSNVSLVYCLVGRDSDMVEKDLQAIFESLTEEKWTPEQVVRAMEGYRGPERPISMRLFVLRTFT